VAASSRDWGRFAYDAARSNAGPASTGITRSNVAHLRRRDVSIAGVVDSAPVFAHGVVAAGHRRNLVVVTTIYGRAVALDAATGRAVWQFVPPGTRSLVGSPQITTASPIIDPTRRFVFSTAPTGLVYRLALGSGHPTGGAWPVRITRDPTREKLPAALNIDGCSLLVTTGGYFGDAPAYQGHVVAISLISGRITAVFNALCSDRRVILTPSSCSESGAAIWGRSGAVVDPVTGRILVATGNGTFDGATNWGDSALALAPGSLLLRQSYTPRDQSVLNSHDIDLGSTAPAPLPISAPGAPEVLLQGGKDSLLRLLLANRLDAANGGTGSVGGEWQVLATPARTLMYAEPASWRDAHGGVHVAVADGVPNVGSGATAVYALTGTRPRLTRRWAASVSGTSPVYAGGLLFVYDPFGSGVHVYDPSNGHTLATLAAPTGHWNSPIVIDGYVVIPSGNANSFRGSGTLTIYSAH
jgi:PQQ-like domain